MKGKRKTSETKCISWEGIQSGQYIPNVTEKVYSFLMENKPNEYSAKELESLIGIENTSLGHPLIRLFNEKKIGRKDGHHRFSNKRVKKHYAIGINEDPNQKLL